MNSFLPRLILTLTFALAISPATAANIAFEQTSFKQHLVQGKPVVLHIHADWCPTCRAQDAVLADLLATNKFKDLTLMRVDFDSEISVLRTYKVHNQSTFIVFKNGKEITRSTGETDRARIAQLLQQAL